MSSIFMHFCNFRPPKSSLLFGHVIIFDSVFLFVPSKYRQFGIFRPTSQGVCMESSAADVAIQAPTKWDFSCNLEVNYESDEIAQIVYGALAVDKELQPDKVRRNMSVSDGKLSVHFEAVEARFLRASYSAFVDVLMLATKSIEEFGKGISF